MLETLEEDWGLPRKHIRERGLLRMLRQKPYQPFRGNGQPDHGRLITQGELISLLQQPEIEYPSYGVAYYPYAVAKCETLWKVANSYLWRTQSATGFEPVAGLATRSLDTKRLLT